MEQATKKGYIPPQVRVYKSLKDITAAQTCFCIDINCAVYCMRYAYPAGSFIGVQGQGANPVAPDCPRYG